MDGFRGIIEKAVYNGSVAALGNIGAAAGVIAVRMNVYYKRSLEHIVVVLLTELFLNVPVLPAFLQKVLPF